MKDTRPLHNSRWEDESRFLKLTLEVFTRSPEFTSKSPDLGILLPSYASPEKAVLLYSSVKVLSNSNCGIVELLPNSCYPDFLIMKRQFCQNLLFRMSHIGISQHFPRTLLGSGGRMNEAPVESVFLFKYSETL